jgi:RimJ/RimL family protein N-acetyltransferase
VNVAGEDGEISNVEPLSRELRGGRVLLIREATANDASAVLDYIEVVSGETDFLGFGPGEFELAEAQEARVLRRYRQLDNQLYLLGLVDGRVVGTLIFTAGLRPRVRHTGELGLSVRKEYWGLGIGGAMLAALIDWARGNGIVTKINLRVRTDNHRAIRLYERAGFAIEGTLHREVFLNGRYFDQFWMGLEL